MNIETNEVITSVPHDREFRTWCARLTADELDSIFKEIETRIGHDEVNVSSFLPGSDWTDTPFWPIYDRACKRDYDAARKFFGLLVWKHMMGLSEEWAFGRYDIRGVAVEGLVYFRFRRVD